MSQPSQQQASGCTVCELLRRTSQQRLTQLLSRALLATASLNHLLHSTSTLPAHDQTSVGSYIAIRLKETGRSQKSTSFASVPVHRHVYTRHTCSA